MQLSEPFDSELWAAPILMGDNIFGAEQSKYSGKGPASHRCATSHLDPRFVFSLATLVF